MVENLKEAVEVDGQRHVDRVDVHAAWNTHLARVAPIRRRGSAVRMGLVAAAVVAVIAGVGVAASSGFPKPGQSVEAQSVGTQPSISESAAPKVTATPPAPPAAASVSAPPELVLPTAGGTNITSASQALARVGTSENDPAHPGSKAILTTVAELKLKLPELSANSERPAIDPARPVWAILIRGNYTDTFGAPIKMRPYAWGVQIMDAQTGLVFETMAGRSEPPRMFTTG